MNRLFSFLALFLSCLVFKQDSKAATTFPPATQSEVNAGVVSSKFVSPATLAGFGGPWVGSQTNLSVWTNGIAVAGPALTNINFIPGANVQLAATNQNGKVSIGISATGGGGGSTNLETIASGSATLGGAVISNSLLMASPGWAQIHQQTNTGVVSLQHSLFLNGRELRNIAKTGATISVGNSSGPDVSIATNQAVTFTFNGSPIHGQRFSLSVSNTAATSFTVGFPSAYSPLVRSNVTGWTVAASNYVVLPFVYTTNEIGGGIWLLGTPTELEPVLQVASAGLNSFLVLLTNAAMDAITISNSYTPQASSMVLSNLVGTVANNVTNIADGWSITKTVTAGTATLNLTNTFIRPASTNATDFRPDFSQATNEFWITSSRTNVTLWPTNLVDGRELSFVFTASVVNYDVTFTNFGVLVYWPIDAATNGTTSLTVTNGQGLEVNLKARTNAVWAAFSRFKL